MIKKSIKLKKSEIISGLDAHEDEGNGVGANKLELITVVKAVNLS